MVVERCWEANSAHARIEDARIEDAHELVLNLLLSACTKKLLQIRVRISRGERGAHRCGLGGEALWRA